MSIIMELDNVRAWYIQKIGLERREIRAVDGISLTITKGMSLGIMGESGCGKSTLASVMMANFNPPLKYVDGKIVLHSKRGEKIDLTKLHRDALKRYVWGVEVAMVPQSAMNALMPTLRIRKIAYDIMHAHYPDIDEYSVEQKLTKIFSAIGLPEDTINRYPFELSGGMRQRAVLAIVALLNPRILIADEPTSALDVVTQRSVLKTLAIMLKESLIESLVFISHDIATVRQIANVGGVMYAGKLVEQAPIETIIDNPLHPYTQGLVASVPDIEIRGGEIIKKKISYIPGQPPDLSNPPPGCRFHPRCPFAMDVCRREEPPMIEVEKNRFVACWLYAKR
ncbi:MAG: ABC transporter ATP-binding protein [Ignisphaera sp.]